MSSGGQVQPKASAPQVPCQARTCGARVGPLVQLKRGRRSGRGADIADIQTATPASGPKTNADPHRRTGVRLLKAPSTRTGTDDRGPENRAQVGASDLQASPLSEGNSTTGSGVRGQPGRNRTWAPTPSRLHPPRDSRGMWVVYITCRAAGQDANTKDVVGQ